MELADRVGGEEADFGRQLRAQADLEAKAKAKEDAESARLKADAKMLEESEALLCVSWDSTRGGRTPRSCGAKVVRASAGIAGIEPEATRQWRL
jgi:hypothetical protein